MLLCNFLRITPQLVVQKLPGHKTHHFRVCDAIFCRGGAETQQILRKSFWFNQLINTNCSKWSHLVSALQDFWDLGKITFSFSGLPCSNVGGLKT